MARGKRTDEDKAFIGRHLRLARDALGLTQKQLGEKYGKTPHTWSQWETGERLADSIIVMRFANDNKISFDWIYGGDMARLPHEIAKKITALIEAENRLFSEPDETVGRVVKRPRPTARRGRPRRK